MTQKAQLVETLKKALKTKGVRYEDIAKTLDLSTGTIKRLFSNQDFNLDRLDQICGMIDLEISDLVEMMSRDSLNIQSLSVEQEHELVSDIKLLLSAHLLINHWTVEDILSTYQFEPLEMTKILAKLDKMKLIDLLPDNRVKLKISRKFSWLKKGPIETFFKDHVQKEFFQSNFSGTGELNLFLSGMLSRDSNQQIQQKIKTLASNFDALHQSDKSKNLANKFGTSLSIAIRPWDMPIFNQFRRKDNIKEF